MKRKKKWRGKVIRLILFANSHHEISLVLQLLVFSLKCKVFVNELGLLHLFLMSLMFVFLDFHAFWRSQRCYFFRNWTVSKKFSFWRSVVYHTRLLQREQGKEEHGNSTYEAHFFQKSFAWKKSFASDVLDLCSSYDGARNIGTWFLLDTVNFNNKKMSKVFPSKFL